MLDPAGEIILVSVAMLGHSTHGDLGSWDTVSGSESSWGQDLGWCRHAPNPRPTARMGCAGMWRAAEAKLGEIAQSLCCGVGRLSHRQNLVTGKRDPCLGDNLCCRKEDVAHDGEAISSSIRECADVSGSCGYEKASLSHQRYTQVEGVPTQRGSSHGGYPYMEGCFHRDSVLVLNWKVAILHGALQRTGSGLCHSIVCRVTRQLQLKLNSHQDLPFSSGAAAVDKSGQSLCPEPCTQTRSWTHCSLLGWGPSSGATLHWQDGHQAL